MPSYLLAPPLAAAPGWQAAWWLAAVASAVALVVYVIVLRMARMRRARGTDALADLRVGLAGSDIWLLAVTFGLFAIAAGMLGQNAGFVIGPLLFAALLPAMGSGTVGIVPATFCLVAAVVGWRARVQ